MRQTDSIVKFFRPKGQTIFTERWNDPTPDILPSENDQYFIDRADDHWKWQRVCELMFSDNDNSGIAAIHSECFKELPTIQSESDPNQGWGEPEDEEN